MLENGNNEHFKYAKYVSIYDIMKISFIGAGKVGSTAAFAALYSVKCDEITLIDLIGDLAIGEAMDLETAAEALGKNVRIAGGKDYSLLKGADIIVITAGIARKPGMTRLDLAKTNTKIIKDIMKSIMQNAENPAIIIVTNPVDVLVYESSKIIGSRDRVLGMGSSHDTARLMNQLKKSGIKEEVMMLGEHGDSMFPLKSALKGKDNINWDSALKAVRERGMEIIKRKGATNYTPAVCIARMIKAIAEDEKTEIPASVVLQGEYGLNDVAMGVPVIKKKKRAC